MNCRADNWAELAQLMNDYGADAAMVQEAVAPKQGAIGALRVFGDPSLGKKPWSIPVPAKTKRRFASAVVVRTASPIEPWVPVPIGEAAYGSPTISHPGQWVAVGLGKASDRVWVVSLYGLWETMPDTRDIYAQSTLHRALSDLALLFQARATKRVVVAGDLNVWRGYGHKSWEPGYRTVFDRLAAYGFTFAGPTRVDGVALERCPCRAGAKCSHVRTYRPGGRPSSTPYQNDYAFVRGMRLEKCVALDDERHWKHSDHCPILIEVEGA